MTNKKPYKVYMVNKMVHPDTGIINTTQSLVGQTWAVSAQQAVSNVKYRYGITANDLYCPYTSGGYRESTLVAYEQK